MSQFRPGDRVKVNKKSMTTDRIGQVGTVVNQDHDANVRVLFTDDKEMGFFPSSLNLLDPPTNPILSGMSSKDLADAVEDTIRATRERVEGVGDVQYSTDKGQKFEGLKVSELLKMAREEAQDLIAYGVMTDIRLARIEAAIEGEGL